MYIWGECVNFSMVNSTFTCASSLIFPHLFGKMVSYIFLFPWYFQRIPLCSLLSWNPWVLLAHPFFYFTLYPIPTTTVLILSLPHHSHTSTLASRCSLLGLSSSGLLRLSQGDPLPLQHLTLLSLPSFVRSLFHQLPSYPPPLGLPFLPAILLSPLFWLLLLYFCPSLRRCCFQVFGDSCLFISGLILSLTPNPLASVIIHMLLMPQTLSPNHSLLSIRPCIQLY